MLVMLFSKQLIGTSRSLKVMNQEIKIFREPVALDIVKQLAEVTFGDFVKGVVDVEKKILGLGGELHADIEAVLLE